MIFSGIYLLVAWYFHCPQGGRTVVHIFLFVHLFPFSVLHLVLLTLTLRISRFFSVTYVGLRFSDTYVLTYVNLRSPNQFRESGSFSKRTISTTIESRTWTWTHLFPWIKKLRGKTKEMCVFIKFCELGESWSLTNLATLFASVYRWSAGVGIFCCCVWFCVSVAKVAKQQCVAWNFVILPLFYRFLCMASAIFRRDGDLFRGLYPDDGTDWGPGIPLCGFHCGGEHKADHCGIFIGIWIRIATRFGNVLPIG